MTTRHRDYDELMLNCLKVSDYNKTYAVRLWLSEVKDKWPDRFHSGIKAYAYKVYERVIGGSKGEVLAPMQAELVASMRNALATCFDQAKESGNWSHYNALLDRLIKVGGFDKPQVEVNNTVQNLNVTPNELMARIAERGRRIGVITETTGGGPGASGSAAG